MFFELYRQRQALSVELNDRTETLRFNEMFSALLAHDLRSPLSAMLASARLLQRRTQDPAALEAAARIVASGNRMARMIEDMLDLARARLGGGIIVKREAGGFQGPGGTIIARASGGRAGAANRCQLRREISPAAGIRSASHKWPPI